MPRRSLRRALLGDPSRRPAGRAADGGRGAARHRRSSSACAVEDFAVHGNGITVRRRRRQEIMRRARHRAGRRRRAVVDACARASATFVPPRFAGRTAWRAVVPAACGGARISRRPPSTSGSGGMRISCTIRSRAERDQYRRHRPRRLAERRAGAPPARAERLLGALRAVALGGGRARVARRARALAEMGAVRSPAAAALGTRAGHAARRCRPSDAPVPRAGGRHGNRGCGRARRMPGARHR